MPRWWQLEEAAVDFGAVAAAPTELLKLVLVEFATVFGNDWFEVPLGDLPTAALCRINSAVVTDTFGHRTELTPFGDGAGPDWRMFELASRDGSADAGGELLLLDALPMTLESQPAEEVVLLRDELANLAWAIERVVESRTGRPLDRVAQEATAAAPSEPPTADAIPSYALQSPVPRNWIPLLPKLDLDDERQVVGRFLARGKMRDPAGGPPIEPLGRLLAGDSLDLYDEEVPRSGARVLRVWQLGRAPDGSTHLWRARRKGAGRGEGSSGLRFDRAERS